MKHRQRIAGCMAVVLTLLLFAGGCSKDAGKADNTNITTEPEHSITLEATMTPEPTAEPAAATPTQTPPESGAEENGINIPELTLTRYEIPKTDAFAFTEDMKLGWNLGNTLDANSDSPQFEDELKYETAWCGVTTSRKLIDKLKEAGFRTVRIPVSWHNHISGEDFTISEAWMDRVQEIVDYVIESDMYAILNIHHDIDQKYYYPSEEYFENSSHYVSRIWTQIAERFSEYGDHLIFESINEPRLIGTNYEWWLDGKNESCIEAVDCINRLNQVFVDTVRVGGGKNPERYLMVPGYGASIDGALNAGFVLPTDTAAEKLIVSVHAYTPYNFALQSPTEKGSTDRFSASDAKSVRDIDSLMKRLYDNFITKGVPVVIGEFGARSKNGNLQDRVDYAAYYIAAAKARGITCCWWDNNAFLGNGENFGLLDRKTNQWKYEEIVEALRKYAELF